MGDIMNPSDLPPDWEAGVARLAEEPIDAADGALLKRVATMYSTLDPVPDDLVDRIQFALSLDALHAELAELQQLPMADLVGARGEPTEVESLTFTSESLTTMVTISPSGSDTVRIDGWVAPGPGALVELRQVNVSLDTEADADGRFVFDNVPHGLSRFVVRLPEEGGAHVITPAVEL
jgi:hypothetical protein